MILKIKPYNPYGKYFLAVEAPDDENADDKKKRNVKVITVKPDNRKRKDFTEVDLDEAPSTNEEESEPSESEEPVTDDGGEDFTDTDDEAVPSI